MKDNKQRLFEMMQKVNPDFKKTLNEQDIQPADQPPTNQNFQLKTYGDLKKLINVIQLKQKGNKIAGIGLDAILGAIPGLGTAKTAFDIFKAAFNKPDTKKTNTWLDKLDIDDDTSAIVDDTVENGFLQTMTNMISGRPDTDMLEPNFDMNTQLVDYLKKNYNNRTITGIPPK